MTILIFGGGGMARINLEDVQVGMVLASDVKDRNGRILLGAGTMLTEKHLKIFKMWGVADADIRGVGKEEVAARAVAKLDPILLKGVEEQLKERFHHTDINHPFNEELLRILSIRFTRREAGRNEI
jgi:hypothetical protein